jgi:hypothetical protein
MFVGPTSVVVEDVGGVRHVIFVRFTVELAVLESDERRQLGTVGADNRRDTL